MNLIRHQGLSFPGIAPGVNNSHVCGLATNFSAIFIRNGFVNYANSRFAGLLGTTSGTPAAKIDSVIGPCRDVGTNYSVAFTTPTGSSGPVTMAAIIRTGVGDDAGIFESDTAASQGAGILANYAGRLYFATDGTDHDSGIALANSTPYFVAATWRNDLSLSYTNFIAKNLNNGKINTAATTSSDLDNVTGTGITIGYNYKYGAYFPGRIAAVAYTRSFCSLQQLTMWAADPWGFWYPPPLDMTLDQELLHGSQSVIASIYASYGGGMFVLP